MKKILIFVFVAGAVALAACGASSTQSDAAATLESVPAEYAGQVNPLGADAASKGAEIFKTNCAACHGDQGHGDGPAGKMLVPAPKNLAELQITATDDYLYWRINTGKQGTSMVAWKGVLADEQIWQVITFLRTLK